MESLAIDRYKFARYLFFKWRYSLGFLYKLTFALGLACLTGLSAQIRIPLPFTPVPVTGQVLSVLLSGILLGKWYGALSQLLYVGIGAAGVPWFAGGGGPPIGPTGGYLIGFIPAALVVGWLTDKYIAWRRLRPQLLLMMVGVVIIYVLGALQFALVMRTGFLQTMMMAVLPFVPVDLAKAVIAAAISSAMLPKASYNGELDRARFPDEY